MATGTVIVRVISRHMAIRTSAPIAFTVLTDVWTMSGERVSSAAARTASIVRSLTTLIAATPYLPWKALSTRVLVDTTGKKAPPVRHGVAVIRAGPEGPSRHPDRGAPEGPPRDRRAGPPDRGALNLRTLEVLSRTLS